VTIVYEIVLVFADAIESDIIREILFFNQLKEFDIVHYSEAQKKSLINSASDSHA
jgi:hypothetical protein